MWDSAGPACYTKYMRAWAVMALGVAVLLGAAAPPEQRRKLVVISIDGLDARYLKDADRLRLKIPTLRKLARQGTFAGVTGVVPDDSWPSSTTLVTGVDPAKHGVLEARNANQVPGTRTLWQAALKNGLKTALLYWPASVSAEASFNCPQYSEGKLGADLPFEAISRKCTPGLVQRISSVYPIFSKNQWNDSTALTGLRYLLQFEQPDLCLVHIADLDQEQRDTGALSLYARDILENQDEMIGDALKNLPEHTQVAIVSDHGFETEEYVVRPRVLTGSKKIQIRNGLVGATTAADATALRKYAGNRKFGIGQEVPLGDVRASFPEATAWVAAFATMPNFSASTMESGKPVVPGSHHGIHSFWPTRPNFRSTLILAGDHIRAMRLPEISILQIAPTLADILGVKLPEAKAASLWPEIKR